MVIHVYGVQGVASSNPAAPTNRIKHLANPLGLAFCFLGFRAFQVP